MRSFASRGKPSFSARDLPLTCACASRRAPARKRKSKMKIRFRFIPWVAQPFVRLNSIVNPEVGSSIVQDCARSDRESCPQALGLRLARAGDRLATADPNIDRAWDDAAGSGLIDNT